MFLFAIYRYSKTCLKRPLKKKTKNGFSRPMIAYCRSKVLQNAQRENSAILSTFIKLSFVFKTFVLSIFECPLKTGFTVLYLSDTYKLYPPLILCILETPKGVLSQTVNT